MKKNWVLIILTGIVVIAAVLRLWQLGNVPPSPDWDEVALGYNAYSIIHTGRDEYGKFLPVILRSFDDYKPALYSYLAIPSIIIFGLNTFAVRLPSAVFGIISVIAVYFLVKELFKDKLKTENLKLKNIFNTEILALLSSFFLAISPWSLQFSRVGFETNVGSALNILAALFFLKGLKKPIYLVFSALFAAFAIYTYQSEKVFLPLLVLALALIYRRQLFSVPRRYIVSAIIAGFIVVLPMVFYISTNKEALLRVKGTSIFSNQTEILKNSITKIERDGKNHDTLGLILDNRRIVYAKTIVAGYISHFDLNWLFIKGDLSRHHAPNMGLLYLFELPLVLLGIYLLIFGKFDRKAKLFVFSWFLLAPLPASITTGVPHAVRTMNFLPTWQIFSAIGLVGIIQLLSNIKLKILNLKILYIVGILYFMFAVFNFIFYLDQYFVQQNYYTSKDWQYGWKETVAEVQKVQGKYKEVIVSSSEPLDEAYMFFLFYLKYSPSTYQKIGVNTSGGFAEIHSFGKYTFRPINWKIDSEKTGVLLVGPPTEIPNGVTTVKTVYYLNGEPAIRIVGR